VGGSPFAVVAGVAAAGADSPLVVATVVEEPAEVAGWPVVEELPAAAEGPVGGSPFAVVAGAAAAGADSPLVVAAVVEEPAEVAGAPVPVAEPPASVEAVVFAAGAGWSDARSGDFWVLMPKPRITAATMIATTANPSQEERFTEPRNRPVTSLQGNTQTLEMQRFCCRRPRCRRAPYSAFTALASGLATGGRDWR